MTQGDDHSSLMSQINVTPFVDVMLVLLIIFMVTAPMMMEGINVSLPEASSKPLVLEKKPLVISINSDNKIFINDFNVTVEHLGEKLLKIIDGKTNREVFLKADKNISYGMVVRVMSEIKGAGIEKLGMVTLPINEKTRK
ncbi:MAG: protein TolR [Deltaproteobacteria bacterium]|nr:protein TolR [Deltaproteobacteria bacterium]